MGETLFRVLPICEKYFIEAYFPPEEFIEKFVEGDFVLVKNEQGKILDIFAGKAGENGFMTATYGDRNVYPLVDSVIVELYADNSKNGYGLLIDEYGRGFTEDESGMIRDQAVEQYIKDCKERGIPPEKCPIEE